MLKFRSVKSRTSLFFLRRSISLIALGSLLTVAACTAWLPEPATSAGHNAIQHGSHASPSNKAHGQAKAHASTHGQGMKDTRTLVQFPEPMRIHTLENMRDHLLTLGRIQEALAAGHYDRAADLAESRLGMSSLRSHGAHDVARYMPQDMQDVGTAMHRTASQFALKARDASVTNDLRPVLAELARVNQTCVTCHAAFRLQ